MTPAATQVDHATLLSCVTPDFHGFTMEQGGSAETYGCAVGDGTAFQSVGKPILLHAGHSYLVAVEIAGEDLTLRLLGADGANESADYHGPEVARLDRSYWRWGNWMMTGRPFAGRIELVFMGGALPADELDRLLHRAEGASPAVAR